MKKVSFIILSVALFVALCQSCKKSPVTVVDFSAYTMTDNECRVIGTPDTTGWTNNVLNRETDTLQLIFGDNIVITDSITGPITISPPCPDSSDGFFIWNVNPTRQCKLKLVLVNTDFDILYYNSYGLNGGPMTIGFDFRTATAFKTKNSYRMFYGFYNSNDSCYFSGHGDIRIVK